MAWQHDNAAEPMTAEKKIKLRAWEMIAEMCAVGVPQVRAHLVALKLAIELKAQFRKIYQGPDKEARLAQFDLLEAGISGYLPMPKEPEQMSEAELAAYIAKHQEALAPYIAEQFIREQQTVQA